MNDPHALAFPPRTRADLLRQFREACADCIRELSTAAFKDCDQAMHVGEAWEHLLKADDLVNRIDPKEGK